MHKDRSSVEQSVFYEDSLRKEETPLKDPTDCGTKFVFELKQNIALRERQKSRTKQLNLMDDVKKRYYWQIFI